jgi:hypothetical protein
MLKYLKDRIALIVLLVAGDSVSLITLIKADELQTNAKMLAISISLLLSLILSLVIVFFVNPNMNKWLRATVVIICLFTWVGYVLSWQQFSHVNARYGNVHFPSTSSSSTVDSVIVAGCDLTPPAQAEADTLRRLTGMIDWRQLFADFNYDIDLVWTGESRDCARDKILWSFSVMIAFLVAGVTSTIEILLIAKKDGDAASNDPKPNAPSKDSAQTPDQAQQSN